MPCRLGDFGSHAELGDSAGVAGKARSEAELLEALARKEADEEAPLALEGMGKAERTRRAT